MAVNVRAVVRCDVRRPAFQHCHLSLLFTFQCAVSGLLLLPSFLATAACWTQGVAVAHYDYSHAHSSGELAAAAVQNEHDEYPRQPTAPAEASVATRAIE